MSTESTDLARQFPWYAVVTSDLRDFSNDTVTAQAGYIIRVLSAELDNGGALDYYIAELDDHSMSFPVEPTDIARLCDVCEEAPATTEARWHHAMLCAGCFAIEAEMVTGEAAVLGDQAPKGSEPWHIEEA